MNGNTAMPTVTFGPDCTYDMLDSILNGNGNGAWTHNGRRFGWAVRVWLKQGFILTAMWGEGSWCDEDEVEKTSLLAWSEKDQDYCKEISVVTDDITKVEVI